MQRAAAGVKFLFWCLERARPSKELHLHSSLSRRRHHHRSTNTTICLLKSPGCLQTNCSAGCRVHVYTIQPPRSCLSRLVLQPSYFVCGRFSRRSSRQRRAGQNLNLNILSQRQTNQAPHFYDSIWEWHCMRVRRNCKELSSPGSCFPLWNWTWQFTKKLLQKKLKTKCLAVGKMVIEEQEMHPRVQCFVWKCVHSKSELN